MLWAAHRSPIGEPRHNPPKHTPKHPLSSRNTPERGVNAPRHCLRAQVIGSHAKRARAGPALPGQEVCNTDRRHDNCSRGSRSTAPRGRSRVPTGAGAAAGGLPRVGYRVSSHRPRWADCSCAQLKRPRPKHGSPKLLELDRTIASSEQAAKRNEQLAVQAGQDAHGRHHTTISAPLTILRGSPRTDREETVLDRALKRLDARDHDWPKSFLPACQNVSCCAGVITPLRSAVSAASSPTPAERTRWYSTPALPARDRCCDALTHPLQAGQETSRKATHRWQQGRRRRAPPAHSRINARWNRA